MAKVIEDLAARYSRGSNGAQTVPKGSSASANAPYLTGQETFVGGSLCKYSDGFVVKISGSYCPRQNVGIDRSEPGPMVESYLIGQDSIVGGSLCKYSNGSVLKISGSYCPRSN